MKDIIQEGAAMAVVFFVIIIGTAPLWLKALLWLLATGLGALSSVGQP